MLLSLCDDCPYMTICKRVEHRFSFSSALYQLILLQNCLLYTSTEFVNATIYEQVNDENDNPVEYYVDMAAFNDGDILRAQDSATTYQIGETVPLQGVYCINKGYAVFRKIQIIDQNAEYSIIKKQTQYGISQYDYIVENASTVSEEDIVH